MEKKLHFTSVLDNQKKLELEIADRERDYREIFDSTYDLIIIMSLEGKIKMVNPASSQILGYSRGELIGKYFRNLIAKEFRDSTYEKWFGTFRDIAPSKFYELEILKKDGGRVLVEMNSRFLKKGGEFNGVQFHARDLTLRKKIENERMIEQKINSISLLAGGIAHDFNNLLTGILGNIDILSYENLTDEQLEIVNAVKRGAYRAVDLANQFLMFSKGGKPIKKPCSLEDIVNNSCNLVMRGRNSKYIIDSEEDLPLVNVDDGQINQVLNNLILNADQSMHDGGIVKISIEKIFISDDDRLPLNNGDYIKVSIKDSGVGIPKENIEKIFNPYFTTKTKGTGLGLATSYSIIKNHEGYISFNSKPQIGTTFFIYLPVTYIIKDVKRKSINETNNYSGNVMVLDDDDIIHQVLNKMLSKLNLKIISFYDGKDLINFMLNNRSNQNKDLRLIIMDLTIPGGMGAKKTIKKLRDFNKSIPVIISSGYSNEILSEYKLFGFNDILNKPYTLQDLKEKISQFL